MKFCIQEDSVAAQSTTEGTVVVMQLVDNSSSQQKKDGRFNEGEGELAFVDKHRSESCSDDGSASSIGGEGNPCHYTDAAAPQ